MQVSGRITELVLRTDDKETGVKISFNLSGEQELELARLRGQQLTFQIEPKVMLRQSSLFDQTKPEVVWAGMAEHPWQPDLSEVEDEEGHRVKQVKCAVPGCQYPEDKHNSMRNHFFHAPNTEGLDAWEEVPDKCGAENCGFPASFHWRRPDHVYQETTGMVDGYLLSHCAVDSCRVPANLHPIQEDLDRGDFDPPEAPDSPEGTESPEATTPEEEIPLTADGDPEGVDILPEPVSTDEGVDESPAAASDRATEETFNRRRSRRSRGSDETETSTEPPEEPVEPGTSEA